MKILLNISFFFYLIIILGVSCQSGVDEAVIIVEEDAPNLVQLSAIELKEDLEKVTDLKVKIASSLTNAYHGIRFHLGTSNSEMMITELEKKGVTLTQEYPGPRGGVIHSTSFNEIIIAGSDEQGLQYAIYDYSEEILGIDPLSYWSGFPSQKVSKEKLVTGGTKIISPPKVRFIGYFENDADELMNLHKPLLSYDWESYTEMIDALVRMKYNVFHFFDALGRSEFYRRSEYQELAPEYQIDMDYVEKMIDYAQDRGMLVQVDLSMGYQDKSLESEYADCWKEHKEKWIEVWNYYLKETAFGKADIFSLRPRNQVWDWEYKSNCGEDKIETFNEVYAVLGKIISDYNPDAEKVLVCYADGMDMFNNGFSPPDDWIVAWSDDGYGTFKSLPDDTRGYPFGTYMHAGFWKNHTVAHPYPGTIDSIMHMMFDKYDALEYCLVNGQQFRPFIFNLEAFSDICIDPDSFSKESYYQKWARRYFDESLHEEIIDLMEMWDESSFGKAGYVQNLWEIKEVIAYLRERDLERPGKPSVKYEARRVENDLVDAELRSKLMAKNHQKATQILERIEKGRIYFYDQIYHPILLYNDLLAFEVKLHELYKTKRKLEQKVDPALSLRAKKLIEEAKQLLEVIYKNSHLPSADPKWNGWYDPAVRRPNNGFPTMEMMEEIDQLFTLEY